MIYRGIGDLRSGEVVSRPVYADDGRVLLRPGTVLTERYIDTLRRRGTVGLHVRAGDEGTLVPRALSEQLRAEASSAVTGFHTTGRRLAARLPARDGESVLAWLASASGEALVTALPWPETDALASSLVDEVLAAASDSVLRVEKGLGDYDFVHSVDVATIAVAIGRRLGIARPELIDLARGALTHDIGMSLIDPGIRNRPGPLSEAERDELRMHPRLGYELLRNAQPSAVLANHVALQHHERQDGSGYPQGRIGGQRVNQGLFDPGRGEIAGLAEICAVADVYDALSSPRPHRPALPHDQVRTTMRALAETKLSLEAVNALLQLVPTYMVGGKVTLLCRRFPRHRGTVVRRNPSQPDRPVVRLYSDDAGAPVEPIELDLSVERGILVRPAV
jgi:HD-GYP domain-containing protein (c-di-GMP phosphodiesterase class II)